MRNRYRLMVVVISGIMTLAMIFIHKASHEKTQEIYTKQMEEMAINLKKDYLKDTVNNLILELDTLKETKTKLYQFNTEQRLRRLQDEKNLSEEEFMAFYISRFQDENDAGLWTAVLYYKDTEEILYENLPEEEENRPVLEKIGSCLAASERVEHGNLVGVFGVHEDYIDAVVKEEIREVIHKQEFSNDSYMWVNEVLQYEGGENYAIRRIHPNLKDTEGSYLSTSMEDAQGNFPYLTELEGIRASGEIFFSYHFKKLNSDIISEKITYAKAYEPYDWIVAMGVHLDDIEDRVAHVSAESDASLSDNIALFLIYSVMAIAIGFLVLYVVNEKYFRKSMEKLESELNVDILTGAGSRRSGENMMSLYFDKYHVSGTAPVILMFDIDNFKRVNDEHGHEIGDRVLVEVTGKVKSALAERDVIIRWGGDEFICLLHQVSEAGIRTCVKRIQEKVDEISIEAEKGTIGASISIGTTRFIEEDSAYTDAVKRADRAMYQSKRQGKSMWTSLWK
ncbi:diguanylate cyclase [Proteiniclasticum sp. C24MP]|uniref:sensor domain-containing diguanylate cyclase n=1 Tax=Proteiniclasticum sp. C24MP TaxID=3374101 RepID=UPI0037544CA0